MKPMSNSGGIGMSQIQRTAEIGEDQLYWILIKKNICDLELEKIAQMMDRLEKVHFTMIEE